jgi:hypothetical protein
MPNCLSNQLRIPLLAVTAACLALSVSATARAENGPKKRSDAQ